jgi:hypothetical protein
VISFVVEAWSAGILSACGGVFVIDSRDFSEKLQKLTEKKCSKTEKPESLFLVFGSPGHRF